MDFALKYDSLLRTFDLTLEEGDIARDTSLQTAVVLSLFSDSGDVFNSESESGGDTDVHAWWGDLLGDGAYPLGSRLWKLFSRKLSAAVVLEVQSAAESALQWLIDDGVVDKVEVRAERQENVVILDVTLYRPKDTLSFRYTNLWNMS